MPHTLDLTVQPRTVVGKKVKQLRHAGIVPGNVYGHGMESTSIQVDAKALGNILKHATATTLVNLKIENGASKPVFVRDVQWAILRREPEHVDFFAIRLDEEMRAAVPIVLRGTAPATREADLILFNPVNQLNVSGLPTHLPEAIAVDISGLTEIDQTIYAKDLHLPSDVQLLDDPDTIIVKISQTRAAPEPEPVTEEPEAPEGEAPAEGEQEAKTEEER